MSGINKRPGFDSPEHSKWFSDTPKWVLYELVRDLFLAEANQGSEAEAPEQWLGWAKERMKILKANGII